MKESKRPIWHPLDKLPLIASLIDEQLEDCQEQLRTLDPEAMKAPVLDDALVERIIRVNTEQQEMLPVYSEQLARWNNESPNDEQQSEIGRLERQLDHYEKILAKLLDLAREYQEFTLEKVLAKDDVEVALEFLWKDAPLTLIAVSVRLLLACHHQGADWLNRPPCGRSGRLTLD